jgi:hypothetical protein
MWDGRHRNHHSLTINSYEYDPVPGRESFSISGVGYVIIGRGFNPQAGPVWVVGTIDGASFTKQKDRTCESSVPGNYWQSHTTSSGYDPDRGIWMPPATYPPGVTPPPSTVILTGRVEGRKGKFHSFSMVAINANGVTYQIDPEDDYIPPDP